MSDAKKNMEDPDPENDSETCKCCGDEYAQYCDLCAHKVVERLERELAEAKAHCAAANKGARITAKVNEGLAKQLVELKASSPRRPHEEQTALEATLRSHLGSPNDILERGARELPRCVKKREYRLAAQWQDRMREAAFEKIKWENLLELYERERQATNLNGDGNMPSLPDNSQGTV